MKKTFVGLLPVFLFVSCLKNNLPRVETIGIGNKWGLSIGSSAATVYSQLQKFGQEKEIYQIGLSNQQPTTNLEDIKDRLPFYYAISLEKNTGTLDRVVFQFNSDTISSITTGGALPGDTDKWPNDVPSEITLHPGDPVSGIYGKLHAIYQLPAYSNAYKIQLSDKPLNKGFDPAMIDSKEWTFYFFTNVRPGVSGQSFVRLYFKDGRLTTIRHEYNEHDVVN